MTSNYDSEFQSLKDQLDQAWSAEIPDLGEIRRCRERMVEHLALCVVEEMGDDAHEPADDSSLRVICNENPHQSDPRGICSPIKSPDIREFERLFRVAFGDSVCCTTAWLKDSPSRDGNDRE